MVRTALQAGVSPETLRKIETGRIATPAFPTVAAIAGVLDLSLDALWAETSAPGRGQDSGPGPDELLPVGGGRRDAPGAGWRAERDSEASGRG